MRANTATKPSLTCYCQACGRTVEMTEKFCKGCGAVLGDIQCPKCGYLGPPSDFINGCPKCLHLNPKGNKNSGILRLDTLKTLYSSDKNSNKTDKRNFVSSPRPTAPLPELPFFANVFILIFLSFGLIGGFLWLNQ